MKGYVAKSAISSNCLFNDIYAPEVSPHIIHVHQTSPDAIEGETVVEEQTYYDHETGKEEGCGIGQIRITQPEAFIGKRVRWIIEVIEEGE